MSAGWAWPGDAIRPLWLLGYYLNILRRGFGVSVLGIGLRDVGVGGSAVFLPRPNGGLMVA